MFVHSSKPARALSMYKHNTYSPNLEFNIPYRGGTLARFSIWWIGDFTENRQI